MAFGKLCSFLVLSCNLDVVTCREPLAPLAVQPVWQAGEPVAVNVDYDVPAFGPQDAAVNVQTLSNVESGFSPEQIHEHHGSSSFLATQVLPVDADRIKKSLYLTQSSRSPPQASVNVIMQEDVQHMKAASKYKGMVDQTRALQNEFRKGLADMSNGLA